MNEKDKTIKKLKDEIKELKIKYQDLLHRYTSQNNEIIKLKAYIIEVLNENKH